MVNQIIFQEHDVLKHPVASSSREYGGGSQFGKKGLIAYLMKPKTNVVNKLRLP